MYAACRVQPCALRIFSERGLLPLDKDLRTAMCKAVPKARQLFGARFAGLRIFFDAGFVSRFRGGFAHGEKRAKHEKEQKQQQGEGEG